MRVNLPLYGRSSNVQIAASDWCPSVASFNHCLEIRLPYLEQQQKFSGALEFIGHEQYVGSPIRWSTDHLGVDQLWVFHLHYHEFLLQYSNDPQFLNEVIVDWIANYRIDQNRNRTNGWHPFCISKRIPVWCMLQAKWNSSEDQAKIYRSIYEQARYLRANLEFDIGGNHLLYNLHALIFASVQFSTKESASWLEDAEKLLAIELDRQILAHGEHFERSTGYHFEVWQLLTDLRMIGADVRESLYEICDPAVERMAQFACGIACPDGTLPLLGDSTKLPAKAVVSLADNFRQNETSSDRQRNDFDRVGDYVVWRDSNDYLLFDAGRAGPDELPAHMHADLLGIEMWIDNKPMVVDCGVFEYADTEMRHYCRGTESHSVLQVDGLDQFDLWSRFRVGYRGHPNGLRIGSEGSVQWSEATHNAYRRIGVFETGRRIIRFAAKDWACIDWIRQANCDSKELVSRLVLHPSVGVEQLNDQIAILSIGFKTLQLTALGSKLRIGEAHYCPRMGVRFSTSKIEMYSSHEKQQVAIGWRLSGLTDGPLFEFGNHQSNWSIKYGAVTLVRKYGPNSI